MTFNKSTSIKNEKEDLEANSKMSNYYITSRSKLPFEKNDEAKTIWKKNQQFYVNDGFGNLNPVFVDKDSHLRLNAIQTNEKGNTQYNIRDFHAVPDLSRGLFFPATELQIITGEQSYKKCNANFAEKKFHRFIPYVDCVSSHIKNAKKIPETQPIGQSSKDIFLRMKK